MLVESLLSELPEETPAVIVVKPERPSQGTSRPSTAKNYLSTPGYNPGMVYTLELATLLTLKDKETVERLGDDLAGCLQGILRDARNLHPLIISRVLHYIMNLLRLSYVCFLHRLAF